VTSRSDRRWQQQGGCHATDPDPRPPRPGPCRLGRSGLPATQRPHDHRSADPDPRRAARHDTPPTSPTPKPTPGPETIVGLWPVRTLAQARELQDSVDAGHQPWLLSAESVATAYAQGELHLFGPDVEQVGPAAYQVRSHHGEWEATLYLAQPVRHDNGVWVVTRVGDPVS
jgi:hypothetical protein